jgi:hypothetical protein
MTGVNYMSDSYIFDNSINKDNEGYFEPKKNEGWATTVTCPLSPTCKAVVKFLFKPFKVFPDGMAKTYSTVENIAVYTVPGLWVLGPVLAGGAISLTAHIFDSLKDCFSNPYFKKITQGAKLADEVLVGYLEDLGFTWSTTTTLAVLTGWMSYDNEDFNINAAPLATLMSGIVLGGIIRYARYSHAHDKKHGHQATQRPLLEIAANTFRAANSSAFIMGLLQDQGVLSKRSLVPSITILATGILGFISGMLKSFAQQISNAAKTLHPALSLGVNSTVLLSTALLLDTVIEMLEDTSLAIAFFAFPNDIFACFDKDHLEEWFFYSNMGISGCYLIILLLVTLAKAGQEAKEILSRRSQTVAQSGTPNKRTPLTSFNNLILEGATLFSKVQYTEDVEKGTETDSSDGMSGSE